MAQKLLLTVLLVAGVAAVAQADIFGGWYLNLIVSCSEKVAKAS